jgi:hypothetical protein
MKGDFKKTKKVGGDYKNKNFKPINFQIYSHKNILCKSLDLLLSLSDI